MKTKENPALVALTTGENGAKNDTHLNTTFPLSKNQARIVKALVNDYSNGVLSNKLRSIGQVMNIHDQRKQLHKKGIFTEIRMEDYISPDGERGRIGRVFLTPEGQERARELLERP
ncbi:MAG: hypothetical protein V1706_15065 [Pseudomonadota bacterium]